MLEIFLTMIQFLKKNIISLKEVLRNIKDSPNYFSAIIFPQTVRIDKEHNCKAKFAFLDTLLWLYKCYTCIYKMHTFFKFFFLVYPIEQKHFY